MKVLLVAHDLAAGGAERVLVTLLRAFQEAGLESACLFVGGHTRAFELPLGVTVASLGLPGGRQRAARIRAMAHHVAGVAPDAILSFMSGVNVDVVVAERLARRTVRQGAAGRRRPPRVVLTEHTVLSAALEGHPEEAVRRKTVRVRRLYPRAAAVVGVSSAVRDDLARAFGVPLNLLHVIPNPVDVEAVRNAGRIAPPGGPGGPPGRPLFLQLASLRPEKGQRILLEAFALARAKVPCRLAFVGDGPAEGWRELEARAGSLGVAEDVEVLGYRANPFPELARATALVVPSSREGLPNVVLEAMALGVPVVSFDWPGAREILRPGASGHVVPPGDVARLADALERLATDVSYRAELAAGAGEDLPRFHRNVIGAKYVRLLSGDRS